MIKSVSTAQFDDATHTSENTLVRLMLAAPDKLSKRLIYKWGKESEKFPLTMLTEGQEGESGEYGVNSIEYTLDIMGRVTYTDVIAYSDYAAESTTALGYSAFTIYMKTNKFTRDFGVIASDGITRARIMTEGELVPGKGYKFLLELKGVSSSTQGISTNLLQAGQVWVMTAPTITEQRSRGNKTSVIGPAKLKNQIDFKRYTKTIAGNQANRVTDIEFEMEDGTTTNFWINEEMRQFDIQLYQMNEEHLWLSEYNRLSDGSIVMKDYGNGEKIPEASGVIEQVKEQNYDTYGYTLPLSKVKNMMASIYDAQPDGGTLDLVLYAGKGFADDFDMAVKSDIAASGFTIALGDKMISGTSGALAYGNTFTQYIDTYGNRVTIKRLPLFNSGAKAEVQKANGIIHPRTRLPLIAHSAILLDQSMYGGERNVRMAYMKGQRELSGVFRGLTPIPASWGVVADMLPVLGKDIDEASYEKKYSKGVAIANTKNCYMLECVL